MLGVSGDHCLLVLVELVSIPQDVQGEGSQHGEALPSVTSCGLTDQNWKGITIE